SSSGAIGSSPRRAGTSSWRGSSETSSHATWSRRGSGSASSHGIASRDVTNGGGISRTASVLQPPYSGASMPRAYVYLFLAVTSVFASRAAAQGGFGGRGGMGGMGLRYGPTAPKLPGVELTGP